MIRSEVYRLYPTLEQAEKMAQTAGCVRAVYNAALEQRKMAWKLFGQSVHRYAQSAELPDLKRSDGFTYLAEPPSCALQAAIQDLDQAFAHFFAGRRGYPKARRKGVHESYRVSQHHKEGRVDAITLDQVGRKALTIKLPKLGKVKARGSRLPSGRVFRATIKKTPLGWHAVVDWDDGLRPPAKRKGPAVGIDRGIAVTVATSNGEQMNVPSIRPSERRRRARLDRRLARQRKGSRRRERTRNALARLRAREARQRKDALHKISRGLVDRYATVALEDLRVQSMTRSARGTLEEPGSRVSQKAALNRMILEQGWGYFKTFLSYKAEEVGTTIILVPPQNTSRRCRMCGHTAPENRETQALFSCVQCGHTEHADVHAAKNILTAAGPAVAAHGASREAVKCEPLCADVKPSFVQPNLAQVA